MTSIIKIFAAPVSSPASRLIGVPEFAALYSAAEFAAVQGLWLSTHIIVAWDRLDLRDEKSVAAALLAFTKCYRDFAGDRGIAPVWTYVHERGGFGLHTHLAMSFPVHEALRIEFMDWVRDWVRRRFGRRPVGALRIRAPKETADHQFIHWLLFHYQVKGYDRSAVLVSARNRPDGQELRLGDLVAFHWRDPGVIDGLKRVGFSSSLGPARRDVGESFPRGHFWPDWAKPLHSEAAVAPLKPRPFRSRFDDGQYDVRRLYGAAFCERVYGILDEPPIAREDGAYLPIFI